MTINLKGIGWDHPRGFDCLVETTKLFEQENHGIRVHWDKRSLRDFGEAPIDGMAREYDFIIVDHPFSGRARQSGCLVDLQQIAPDAVEAALKDQVGESARSYHFDGGVWGLPTDAACQIAAYRPDLLERIGASVPQNFDDVRTLAKLARQHDMWIGAPTCPTDAICQVMSYAANLGHPPGAAEGEFLPRDIFIDMLDLLREIVGMAHPNAVDCNPIQMLEHMSHSDDIAYVPLAFGYSNYARHDRNPIIRGADFAGPGPDPKAGALLGGAGCTVTTSCRETEAAATYLRWLHRPEIMAGIYFETGGQPGSRTAWNSDAVNAASNGFFADTLETIDRAYLRPRFDGFVPFMERSGQTINAWLRGDGEGAIICEDMLADYARAYEIGCRAA